MTSVLFSRSLCTLMFSRSYFRTGVIVNSQKGSWPLPFWLVCFYISIYYIIYYIIFVVVRLLSLNSSGVGVGSWYFSFQVGFFFYVDRIVRFIFSSCAIWATFLWSAAQYHILFFFLHRIQLMPVVWGCATSRFGFPGNEVSIVFLPVLVFLISESSLHLSAFVTILHLVDSVSIMFIRNVNMLCIKSRKPKRVIQMSFLNCQLHSLC
jgi:hypothetical protein